ncbi:sodium/glutamate symporter [Uruburuella testudinis]|uniref:Sodium/glutamate symporter n=1 Tax=Uruburuella testudinis TaxID=1282863 RepID=A0ABY4DY99_9NEIS|nr:sodium/glutamate symporter [Uruburuella testudinis]UOO81636.1 sodium/glutamate symporter [Uruburuella testudinis]
MEWEFNSYYTLIAATVVLLVGKLMVNRIKFLQNFNIPEPVAGGLLAAVILFGLHYFYGASFKFEKPLQDAFMLMFFTSIGLSADFSRLRAGGMPLIIFLILVSVFIVVQNGIGVGMATAMGLDPLIGLMTGSVTLTGGHGTAGAWGSVFENQYGVTGATGLGMAAATFGLVVGGLIGGPVARRLVNKMHRPRLDVGGARATHADGGEIIDDPFEVRDQPRLITASSAIETLAMFAVCLSFAEIMNTYVGVLPKFVWALGAGVILRNVLVLVFKFNMFDRAIDVFGNASLSLFLAMALLNLKLWELSGLAGPVVAILAVQTLVMALFAYFITFRVMGKNYDAAVLSAGHCGFGMGATPTAVANMQSVTEHFGPSHKAFLIVPMVGAFFIDLVNVAILKIFISILH